MTEPDTNPLEAATWSALQEIAESEGLAGVDRPGDALLADVGIDSLFIAELIIRVGDAENLYVSLALDVPIRTVADLVSSLREESL